MKFKLCNIDMDSSIQCRASIDTTVIEDYAERMAEGDAFPAIELYGTQERAWIGDGWHRVLASIQGGFIDIEANLHNGGRAEALKAALGANVTNGLRRTNADKRRCVEIALREFPKLSDRAIAEMCGVRHPMVGAARPNQLEDYSSSTRIGRDGKERPATRTTKTTTTITEGNIMEEPHKPKQEWVIPKGTKIGPPRNGMQFARLAIMRLQEIAHNDVERTEALNTVREWINENE